MKTIHAMPLGRSRDPFARALCGAPAANAVRYEQAILALEPGYELEGQADIGGKLCADCRRRLGETEYKLQAAVRSA